MADIESSLRTIVLQGTGIAAAFGNRFYWNQIPEGVTYPLIKAQTITDNAMDTHSNNWGGRTLVQLDVYDDDKANANSSSELIRAWLHRYRGTLGGKDATIKVRNVQSGFDTEARLFRRMLEVEILYIHYV